MLHERERELLDEMLDRYRAGKVCRWPTVSPKLISEVWEHFSRTGNVVDDGRFERILSDIRDCVLRLRITTIMAGHHNFGPAVMYELDSDGLDADDFYDWVEMSTSSPPISDYGLEPLLTTLSEALSVPSSRMGEKLKLVDRMLNFVHQRGDLSALLVTGGRSAVITLIDAEDQYGSRISKGRQIETLN